MAEPGSNDILSDSTGNTPKVSDDLEVKNRAVESVDQAFSICESMVNDSKKRIMNAARVTAKINGERPYNQTALKKAEKGYKTNISTGFLATECSKVAPRFYMPIKTAKYLTAAALSGSIEKNQEKTAHFRETITNAIRSWPKFNAFTRGLSREVATHGYGFAAWFDEFEWRPSFMRMDKGFVPQGTEVGDEPMFFMAKWDYKPSELLELVKTAIDAGIEDKWNKDNAVDAINSARPKPVDATYPNARSYEELIRQGVWQYTYSKGAKVIETWHLFAKETTGRVSHYILLSNTNPTSGDQNKSPDNSKRLLYENLDQYESMADAMATLVFEYGDGTVHGAWGVGQLLYDLAAQVEKIRCDAIDNMRMTTKIKAQVADAKNANDVGLVINDEMVIVAGATLAGNQAALGSDPAEFELLDAKLTQLAQQKIGAFVPPIPLQPSDIKAAQINAAMSKEQELQQALLENWLIQFAQVIRAMTRRLCNPASPDPVAKETVKKLLEKLTPEELDYLVNQPAIKSVYEFTDSAAAQRAQFAQAVMNNPLFKQKVVARVMAEAVGDQAFVDDITVPDGDNSDQVASERQQQMENAAMALGQNVKVLPSDDDWIHMQTMKGDLQNMMTSQTPNSQLLGIGLQHYGAHMQQGIAKQTLPKDQINNEKAWLASAERVLASLQEREAIQKQASALARPVGQ